MKNGKQSSSPTNNKEQKKEKANNTKIHAPSKLQDDQLSIVFTLSTSPNPRSSSCTRLFHHPDTHLAFVHTEKHRHNFFVTGKLVKNRWQKSF
jgi:elongation factor P--beta-lysine ligase